MKFIKDNVNINFIGKRKIAFIISISIIVVGLVFAISRGEKNLGIDFKGGLLQQVEFDQSINIEQVRHALKIVGQEDAQIQQVADSPNMVIIKTGYKTKEEVIGALKQSFPGNPFVVVREELVGPVVGKDLRKQGLLAILFSLIGILLYISWRFEFRFAVGAVAALFHDVLITVGFLCFTGREISLQVLAALLTIVGYSLNDTIVVFDRIREDMKLYKKEPFETVINKSINQTLSRTILTSITTLFVVLCLFLFGGEVIHDFAFALLVGVLVGTYSSIFIASPVLLLWKKS